MTRLIDADALLEEIKTEEKEGVKYWPVVNLLDLITNAPTVQREGWVSVPIEPTEEMLMAGCEAGLDIKTLMDDELFATDKAAYKALIKTYINK